MNHLYYTPLTRLEGLQREFNRAHVNKGIAANSSATTWTPNLDIEELSDKFHVLVDVPGVSDEDIDITLDKNVLTIKGKRQGFVEDEKSLIKRQERPTGEFNRQFTLPDSIDSENISAKSELGLLKIVLPKVTEKKALSIAIS